mmetsp:Transcript_6843/g.20048  ORF Transcript_6843/g.20048 Transcript_6843/m.20048 type:complete len:224 (+) Transcript_6843:768-1439(+)
MPCPASAATFLDLSTTPDSWLTRSASACALSHEAPATSPNCWAAPLPKSTVAFNLFWSDLAKSSLAFSSSSCALSLLSSPGVLCPTKFPTAISILLSMSVTASSRFCLMPVCPSSSSVCLVVGSFFSSSAASRMFSTASIASSLASVAMAMADPMPSCTTSSMARSSCLSPLDSVSDPLLSWSGPRIFSIDFETVPFALSQAPAVASIVELMPSWMLPMISLT